MCKVVFGFLTFMFLLGEVDRAVASNFSNQVSFQEEGDYIIVKSNAIPSHDTGEFPNSGNPNTISEQNINVKFPAKPKFIGNKTKLGRGAFGIALNGVLFEPQTAECYGKSRGQPARDCQWNEEAIKAGIGTLGLDQNNAHVQPSGMYHYHGLPDISFGKRISENIIHVGYAADGFKIVVDESSKYKPSFKLKSGKRSSGPGGNYDGAYTQDYEYLEGYGNLDECNGVNLENDEYVYFVTKQYPYVSRCWNGKPDESFSKKSGRGQHERRRGGPRHHGHPPPHHRRLF